MQIRQRPFHGIQNLLPQHKEKALAGRFFHYTRVFVVKSENAYLAVTLTIFERFKAAFLHILGKDYSLNGKKVAFVSNSQLKKLILVPVKLPQHVPLAASVQAVMKGNAQQPIQQGAGVQKVSPATAHQPVQKAAMLGIGQQPASQAKAEPAGTSGDMQQQVQGPAQQPLAPQNGQRLDPAEEERIIRRGFPYSRTSMAQLEALIPQFEAYMRDRQYQADQFGNGNPDLTRVDCKDLNRPAGLDINTLEIFLRLMVMRGRIAAFVRGRAAFNLFENERQIIWDAENYKRDNVFTRAKLQEIDQHMMQLRFPELSTFSNKQKTRYEEIVDKLKEVQYHRVKDCTMGEACDLKITQMGSHEVMDFLVKANVISAWNYFQRTNNLLLKFAPTDVLKNPGSGVHFPVWRDATVILREEEFKRRHRIEIPASADLSKFKQPEVDRLKKIVELLNKRVDYGQPSKELHRTWADKNLLQWLKDQQFIYDFCAPNAIAPFLIYVTEEDRKH